MRADSSCRGVQSPRVNVMDFFGLDTCHQVARRRGQTDRPPREFYLLFIGTAEQALRRGIPDAESMELEKLRYVCELDWYSVDRPYFKIWPDMIPLLGGVGIDVPVDYLQLPFKAFLLRFPKEENPLRLPNGRIIQTILVGQRPNLEGDRRLLFWVDFGEIVERTGLPNVMFRQFDLASGLTIDEAFGRLPGYDNAASSPRFPSELQMKCLRIATSVCFLSTGADRVIEPDVLGKDLQQYLEAQIKDPPLAERLCQKARRRGKLGWHVGRADHARRFLRSPTSKEGAAGEPHGQLTHQHQRRAHFRFLPSGKPVLVRQATVRPDLPPPSHAPQYAVKR
jgi:hypothetical protein